MVAEAESISQEPLESMSNDEFVANVTRWAHDRNLITGSSPDRQYLKLMEEVGEYYEACEQCDRNAKMDALGDIDTVLVIILLQCGADPLVGAGADRLGFLFSTLGRLAKAIAKGDTEGIVRYALHVRSRIATNAFDVGMDIGLCRAQAWKEIKNRKGWCENGIFVKEPE